MKKSEKQVQAQSPISGFMKLMRSTKISPILGLAALLSILYYKNTGKETTKKKVVIRSNVDRTIPVFASAEQLGQTRENGPVLTKSFFETGDLVISKYEKTKRYIFGVVIKDKKKIKLLVPSVGTKVLLPWLKDNGGRFALFRTRLPVAKRVLLVQQLSVELKDKPQNELMMRSLRAAYQKAGISLPKEKTDKSTIQKWLKFLAGQSHYNDFQ